MGKDKVLSESLMRMRRMMGLDESYDFSESGFTRYGESSGDGGDYWLEDLDGDVAIVCQEDEGIGRKYYLDFVVERESSEEPDYGYVGGDSSGGHAGYAGGVHITFTGGHYFDTEDGGEVVGDGKVLPTGMLDRFNGDSGLLRSVSDKYERDNYFGDDIDESDGGVEINPSYTHFAVNRETGKIWDGWEYDDLESDSFKRMIVSDLRERDLNPDEFQIKSIKGCNKMGIDPFDSANWQEGV